VGVGILVLVFVNVLLVSDGLSEEELTTDIDADWLWDTVGNSLEIDSESE
jgi:hypothetical protein